MIYTLAFRQFTVRRWKLSRAMVLCLLLVYIGRVEHGRATECIGEHPTHRRQAVD
jgi:hypothetical protein